VSTTLPSPAAGLLFLVSLTALSGAPLAAPQLTARTLLAHPGLERGRFTEVREDWLAGIEADPDSRLAEIAAELLAELDRFCPEGIDPTRLEELIARTRSGNTSLELRLRLLREVRRRRFSDAPQALARDLFGEFVTHWWVLGPLGPLDATDPLRLDGGPDAPEQGLAEGHRSGWGELLNWRPLTRSAKEMDVAPDELIFPDSGGCAYLLAFVHAEGEDARLQIFSGDAFSVYWNGRLVLEELREGHTQTEYQFSVPVGLGRPWNALLIRYENGRGSEFAARLLDPMGRLLAHEEAEADPHAWPAWERAPHGRDVLPDSPWPAPPFEHAFDGPLAMRLFTLRQRCDRALAIEAPSEPEALPAWLVARHAALRKATHLPREIERQQQIEIEERLARLGHRFPEVEIGRVERAIAEDRPDEALALARELLERHPQQPIFEHLHALALTALDPTGSLARPVVQDTLRRFPRYAPALDLLAQWSAGNGDSPGALDWNLRSLAADGDDAGVVGAVIGGLAQAGEIAAAQERLDRWRAQEPGADSLDDLQRRVWFEASDREELFAFLRREVERRAGHPGPLLDLALELAGDDRREEAVEALLRAVELAPGNPQTRRALELLGVPDRAEEFFAAFAPDRDEALAAAGSATDASTALVLDSGLAYVRRDGTVHQRTHSIRLALDRTGTEAIHEEDAQPGTRLARVLEAGGATKEPIVVDGTWVWPSLDPGDAVELVSDYVLPGRRGVAPSIGPWRFASFEQPFVRSRYVVFIPGGLPGEWKRFHLSAPDEEIPWRDGVVHVFFERDQPRQEDEPFRPSYGELLPWVEYGADLPDEIAAALFRRHFEVSSALAADVAVELRRLAVSTEGSELERARALYEAVTERVLDFSGGGDTTDVWTLRRGDPTGLLAALYREAGIEYDWAILRPAASPELIAEPVRAFSRLDDFELPVLRLAVRDEADRPVWVILRPGARGTPFGRVPEGMEGARAWVFTGDGTEWSELPRSGIADAWTTDVDVTYKVRDDGSAEAWGRIRITGVRGALMREQLSKAEPEQRAQAARGISSSVISGLDLDAWEFLELERNGAPMNLRFEGVIPGFVQTRGQASECRLRLLPSQLSTSFGAAERTWPLALRIAARTRSRVRLECPTWRPQYPHASLTEERQGFRFSFEVEREDDALVVERVVELRGMWLEPGEVPAFLTRAKELEDIESTPVRLER
jgi:tetratricopeptide (TPR) repeat protein